jgi:rubrerythrin
VQQPAQPLDVPQQPADSATQNVGIMQRFKNFFNASEPTQTVQEARGLNYGNVEPMQVQEGYVGQGNQVSQPLAEQGQAVVQPTQDPKNMTRKQRSEQQAQQSKPITTDEENLEPWRRENGIHASDYLTMLMMEKMAAMETPNPQEVKNESNGEFAQDDITCEDCGFKGQPDEDGRCPICGAIGGVKPHDPAGDVKEEYNDYETNHIDQDQINQDDTAIMDYV